MRRQVNDRVVDIRQQTTLVQQQIDGLDTTRSVIERQLASLAGVVSNAKAEFTAGQQQLQNALASVTGQIDIQNRIITELTSVGDAMIAVAKQLGAGELMLLDTTTSTHLTLT